MNNFLEVPQKNNILRGGLILFGIIALLSMVMFANFASNEGGNIIWGIYAFVAFVIVSYTIVRNILKQTKGYSENNNSTVKTLQFLDKILQIVVLIVVAAYSYFGLYNQPGGTFVIVLIYKISLLLGSPFFISILILAIIILELLITKRTPRNKSYMLIWCILLAASVIVLPYVSSNFGLAP